MASSMPGDLPFIRALGFSRAKRIRRGLAGHKYSVKKGSETFFLNLFFGQSASNVLHNELCLGGLLRENQIPCAQIIESGTIELACGTAHYMLREYLQGSDCQELFEFSTGRDWENISPLLKDLAAALHSIHSITLAEFGELNSWGVSYPPTEYRETPAQPTATWLEYLREISLLRRSYLLTCTDCGLQENLSPTLILAAWTELLEVLDQSTPLLSSVVPRLIHNDALPSNFLAARKEESGPWRLVAVLDIGDMIGGDPHFDLVAFENWTESSHCLGYIRRHAERLCSGYKLKREEMAALQAKRPLYTAFRSLNFLTYAWRAFATGQAPTLPLDRQKFQLELALSALRKVHQPLVLFSNPST